MSERTSISEGVKGNEYRKTGAVIFIFSLQGNILVTRELSTKVSTGKTLGDYSVLCESSEDGELPQDTAIRGIEEELGVASNVITQFFCAGENDGYRGLHEFIPNVGAHTYVIQSNNEYRFTPANGFTEEMQVVGWMTIDDFDKLPLRAGVRNLFNKAIENGWFSSVPPLRPFQNNNNHSK